MRSRPALHTLRRISRKRSHGKTPTPYADPCLLHGCRCRRRYRVIENGTWLHSAARRSQHKILHAGNKLRSAEQRNSSTCQHFSFCRNMDHITGNRVNVGKNIEL